MALPRLCSMTLVIIAFFAALTFGAMALLDVAHRRVALEVVRFWAAGEAIPKHWEDAKMTLHLHAFTIVYPHCIARSTMQD